MFEYDSSVLLKTVSVLVEENAKWSLHDVSYGLAESSAQVQAWLVSPSGSNRFPFVVFLHGGGQDRSAFLAEATLLADTGIASLLIDLPQARAVPKFSDPEKDRAAFIQTVVSIRRGLDFLAFRPDIDMSRGALVGFSFGGGIGSIVTAVDTRVGNAILIASVPRMSEFWRSSAHSDVVDIRRTLSPGRMDQYAEKTKDLDAIEFLQPSSNARVFFQFSAGDEVVTEEQVKDFLPYATVRNCLKIYESPSHYAIILNTDARLDRIHWLKEQLCC